MKARKKRLFTPKEMAEHLIFRFNIETEMQQPFDFKVHDKKAIQSAKITAQIVYHSLLDTCADKADFWKKVLKELK